MIKCLSNGKVIITHLIVELIKKILLYKMSYFPETTQSKNEIKNDLDLSSCAPKSDLKTEHLPIHQKLSIHHKFTGKC